MSGWVKTWAAPVQPCLPGWFSIVLCTGQPGCWEDFLIALGMGALSRAPRGPNFRDEAPALVNLLVCHIIQCKAPHTPCHVLLLVHSTDAKEVSGK